METLCLQKLDDSRKAICLYCMALVLPTESIWMTRNGKSFCCWECVEEYDKLQYTY